MKKTIIVITVIVTILCMTKKELTNDNMIRFRIIANSNEEEDQVMKKKVIHSIAQDLIFQANTKEEVELHIMNSIPSIKEKIDTIIPEGNYDINYGMNHFPEKTYQGTTFPEGEYESLVITLGEGIGDNFWCILFPPLCVIDDENIEYKSFIKEALNKFF